MESSYEMPNTFKYDRLGTLCDEPNCLTCSYYVANKSGLAKEVIPFESFELAIKNVKNGVINAALIPGAYPDIKSFIMDDELVATETFIMKIPSLVVVGNFETPPHEVEKIFHHPATNPLLPEVRIKFQESEFVTSNPKACEQLLSLKFKSSIAITNEISMNFYKLHLYQILRPGIQMPWVCFSGSQNY